jgi:integrase
VKALDLRSVEPAANIVAAINLFLKRSALSARAAWERAEALGLKPQRDEYAARIAAIDGFDLMSPSERISLRQKTLFAHVARANPDGIKKPRGLKLARIGGAAKDRRKLDFPIIEFQKLISAATCYRDQVAWLGEGGAGLRTSEMTTLRWSNVDLANREIYVDDPNRLRYAVDDIQSAAPLRFKGRELAQTYFFPPCRDLFFDALKSYMEREATVASEHDFVLQDIRNLDCRGRPYYALSDTARIAAFKRACRRAQVSAPHGDDYTPQSLRHMYGVYMLNYLPSPGGFGLAAKEVQQLMGHRNEASTHHYARPDKLILAAKLLHADNVVSHASNDWKALPSIIAARLRNEAARIDGGGAF